MKVYEIDNDGIKNLTQTIERYLAVRLKLKKEFRDVIIRFIENQIKGKSTEIMNTEIENIDVNM